MCVSLNTMPWSAKRSVFEPIMINSYWLAATPCRPWLMPKGAGMQGHHWGAIASVALALMTAACASVQPHFEDVRAQLPIPIEVERPCTLERMGEGGDIAALETAYMRRGEALLACNNARQLALDLLLEERGLARWKPVGK